MSCYLHMPCLSVQYAVFMLFFVFIASETFKNANKSNSTDIDAFIHSLAITKLTENKVLFTRTHKQTIYVHVFSSCSRYGRGHLGIKYYANLHDILQCSA